MRILYGIFFIIVGGVIISSFIIAGVFDRGLKQDDNIIIKNKDISMETLRLTSASFGNNGKIPAKHTCDGEGISPKLNIEGVDKNAKSLTIIMDDPDAPSGTWDHWIKFNISTSTREIKEGTEPSGISGIGTSGNKEYFGPCPPDKEHRYFFKLFSLDTELDLKEGATKKDVEKAMEGHILQRAELIGVYERKQNIKQE